MKVQARQRGAYMTAARFMMTICEMLAGLGVLSSFLLPNQFGISITVSPEHGSSFPSGGVFLYFSSQQQEYSVSVHS
jgi:hypothetical protein